MSSPEPIERSFANVPAAAERLEEVDLWWGAYATRTMLPSFIVSGLLSSAVAGLAWYLVAVRGLDRLDMRYSAYAIIAAIWAQQLLRWAYRIATFNYRLTTRRLLIERNFVRSGRAEIALEDVDDVVVTQAAWEARLGIGTLRMVCARCNPPSFVLDGVKDPQRIASQIRSLSRHLRDHQPIRVVPQEPAPAAGHVEGEV
jgi:hypothetical protein